MKKSEKENSLVKEIFVRPSIENISICDAIISIAENIKNGCTPDNSDELSLAPDAEELSGLEEGNSETDTADEQKILLEKVSAYLKTNYIQTLIFCALFAMQYERRIDLEDIAGYLSLQPVTLLRYKKDIDKMNSRGLIRVETITDRYDGEEHDHYMISKEACECITSGKKLHLKKLSKTRDVYAFLEKVDSIVERNRVPSNNTLEELKVLEKDFHAEPYIKNAMKKLESQVDRMIIYMLSSARVQTYDVNIGAIIRRFFSGAEKSKAKQLFLDGKHLLQTKGYVELEPCQFVDKSEIYVTKEGLQILLGEDAMCFSKEKETGTALLPEKISEKKLFYTQELEKQISTISNVFEEENFKALQERLEKKGMHKGVAVLFYGAPGTGKTESVLQIAKQSGRAVVQVDISETKTKWFGESERLTKRIFTSYRRECEEARQAGRKTPILFINEADAIISKRRDIGDNSCGQTENALQNIFLEEIENLEGILIATTNLANNMDGAFDRRFLFKVKFEKPEANARAKIWQSKLAFLSKADAYSLASRFDFSGGQIDNIARKIEIDEVITGVVPSFESIVSMCDHEILENQNSGRRVGFCA